MKLIILEEVLLARQCRLMAQEERHQYQSRLSRFPVLVHIPVPTLIRILTLFPGQDIRDQGQGQGMMLYLTRLRCHPCHQTHMGCYIRYVRNLAVSLMHLPAVECIGGIHRVMVEVKKPQRRPALR